MCSPANTCEPLQSMLRNPARSHLLILTHELRFMCKLLFVPLPSQHPNADGHPSRKINNQGTGAPEIVTLMTGPWTRQHTSGKARINVLLRLLLPGTLNIHWDAPLMQHSLFYRPLTNSSTLFTAHKKAFTLVFPKEKFASTIDSLLTRQWRWHLNYWVFYCIKGQHCILTLTFTKKKKKKKLTKPAHYIFDLLIRHSY